MTHEKLTKKVKKDEKMDLISEKIERIRKNTIKCKIYDKEKSDDELLY